MSALLAAVWPGLAAALVLGLGLGALTGLPRGQAGLVQTLPPALALAVLAGLGLAASVSGPAGLWVETAALTLAAYLAGCGIGGVGRAVRENIAPDGGGRVPEKDEAAETRITGYRR